MPKGLKNLYQCSDCHDQIVTLDLVDGTTPFMLACHVTPDCKGMMTSSFYQCEQNLPFHYEWFKPDSLEGYDEAMLEYINKGGLVIRRRQINLENLPNALLRDAIVAARDRNKISATALQRALRIIYPTAAMLMIQLIKYGVIFPKRNDKGEHIVVAEINWQKENER